MPAIRKPCASPTAEASNGCPATIPESSTAIPGALLVTGERQKQRILLLADHLDVAGGSRDVLRLHLVGQPDLDQVPLVAAADILDGGRSAGGLQTLSEHGRVPSRIIRRPGGRETTPWPPFRHRLLSRQLQMWMTARRAVRHHFFVSARLPARCNSASARRRAASR